MMAPRLGSSFLLVALASTAARETQGQELQACDFDDDACFTQNAGRLGDRVCPESCLAPAPYCTTGEVDEDSCSAQWLTHPCPGMANIAGFSMQDTLWNANPASGQDWATSDGVAVCTTCPAGKYVDSTVGFCSVPFDGSIMEPEIAATQAECGPPECADGYTGDPPEQGCQTAPEWSKQTPPGATTPGSALCASCPAGKYQDLHNVGAPSETYADEDACYATAGQDGGIDESDPACQLVRDPDSSVCKDCPAGKTSPVASESEDACVEDQAIDLAKGSGAVERAVASIGLLAGTMALARALA